MWAASSLTLRWRSLPVASKPKVLRLGCVVKFCAQTARRQCRTPMHAKRPRVFKWIVTTRLRVVTIHFVINIRVCSLVVDWPGALIELTTVIRTLQKRRNWSKRLVMRTFTSFDFLFVVHKRTYKVLSMFSECISAVLLSLVVMDSCRD